MQTEKRFVIPDATGIGTYTFTHTSMGQPLSLIQEAFDAFDFHSLEKQLFLAFNTRMESFATSKQEVMELYDCYHTILQLVMAGRMIEDTFKIDLQEVCHE